MNALPQSNPSRRVVTINGEIGHYGMSAQAFRDACGDAEEVHVILNCLGGDANEAFAIHDFLRTRRRATAAVPSICISAGVIILAACDEVFIGLQAKLMVHDVHCAVYAPLSRLEEKVKELHRARTRIIDLLHARTGQPRDVVEHWVTGGPDRYFCSCESIEIGLADGFLPSTDSTADVAEIIPFPVAPGEQPPSDSEKLFGAFLHAVKESGGAQVRNKQAFGRELAHFFTYHIHEIPATATGELLPDSWLSGVPSPVAPLLKP